MVVEISCSRLSHCGDSDGPSKLIGGTFPVPAVAHMELIDPVDSTSTIDFSLQTLQVSFPHQKFA